MRTLVGFELRKIVKKRSFVIAFFVFTAIQTFLAFSGCLGNTYINGELLETHMERNKKDLEYGRAFSGRTVDEALLREIEAVMSKVDIIIRELRSGLYIEAETATSNADMTDDGVSYMLTDMYQNEVRPYEGIFNQIKGMAGMQGLSVLSLSEEEFYAHVDELREDMYAGYGLSEKEKKYWQTKADSLPDKLTYEYSLAYESLIHMHGSYMTLMLLTFFLSMVMVNVFMVEANQRTDQLVFSTRLGRGKLYGAKLLAGILVTFVVTILFVLIDVIGNATAYGWDGFHASLQSIMATWYPYPLSAGETWLIMLGILVLSAILIAVITMVLAWVIKNSVFTIAIMIGGLFVARLIPVPPLEWGLISQLWNMIPINLLKFDQGFSDMRLYSLPGISLTPWQFAPILFVFLGVCVIFAGKMSFCKAQIKGR